MQLQGSRPDQDPPPPADVASHFGSVGDGYWRSTTEVGAVANKPFGVPRRPDELTPYQIEAAHRRPVKVTVAVVGLYVVNAVLAQVAADFMAVRVLGPLNVGFTLALLLLAATVGATQWHAHYTRTTLDSPDERTRPAEQRPEPRW